MTSTNTGLQTAPETTPAAYEYQPTALDAGALLRAAIDAQMPVESLQRLLDMRAQLRAESAAGAFAAALANFQCDLPPIEKKKTANAGSYKYRYADLADIWRAIGNRLHDCGLSVTFDTVDREGGIDVVCRVHHIAGHCAESRFPVPIDRAARMSLAQQVGAALTYGRRYALTAALGIVTADEDTDGHGAPEPSRPNSAATNGSTAARQPQRPRPHAGTPPPGNADPQPHAGASGDKGASLISDAQHRRLEARITELGLQSARDRIKSYTVKRWQVDSLKKLNRAQYDVLYGQLDDFAERIAIEGEATAQPPAEGQQPPA